MLTSQIAVLACMAFGIEYAGNPRRAVRRLQALLRSDQACAARLALLAKFAARGSSISETLRVQGSGSSGTTVGGDEEHFARIADVIKDRRLGRSLRSGDISPEEIDALLGDPHSIVVLHRGITLIPESVTQILVQQGWSAVEPILPYILDSMLELAKVKKQGDRDHFRNYVTSQLQAISWQDPPGRFRDLLRENVNAWLADHRMSAIPEINWATLVEDVAFRGGLGWLIEQQNRHGQFNDVLGPIAKTVKKITPSVGELYYWTEAGKTDPRKLRAFLQLSDRYSLAAVREVCDHLMTEIRRNWASASDVLELRTA